MYFIDLHSSSARPWLPPKACGQRCWATVTMLQGSGPIASKPQLSRLSPMSGHVSPMFSQTLAASLGRCKKNGPSPIPKLHDSYHGAPHQNLSARGVPFQTPQAPSPPGLLRGCRFSRLHLQKLKQRRNCRGRMVVELLKGGCSGGL